MARRAGSSLFFYQVPYFVLVLPEVGTGIANSLLRMRSDGGDIPKWPIASVYSGCMIGTHANLILLDAVVKGLPVDAEAAYAGMRAAATESRPHGGRGGWELEQYNNLSYVPFERGHSNSVSLTLAFSYDDWAVGSLAFQLSRLDDANFFLSRSKRAYQNIWDAKRRLMCPRTRDGEMRCPIDPAVHWWLVDDGNAYCEGDPEEWKYFVPHDLDGLIALFPSADVYADDLDVFFERTLRTNETTLPNPYYWAGNEPGIFEPFQFNAAGRADLTQKRSRQIMMNAYRLVGWFVQPVQWGAVLFHCASPGIKCECIHELLTCYQTNTLTHTRTLAPSRTGCQGTMTSARCRAGMFGQR